MLSRLHIRLNIKDDLIIMTANGSGESSSNLRPLIQQVVALGLHHALCVSKSVAFDQAKGAAGASHRAVEVALHVQSWGKAAFNCLGHGINVNLASLPRSIPFFDKKNVAQVSCGDYHSAVLVLPQGAKKGTGGTVYTFGLGTGGRLGYHISDDAENADQNKQAGLTATEPSWCTTNPQPVGLALNLKYSVLSLSCGANHTLVTTVDGSLFAWGMGAFGVLGTGKTDNQYTPVRVVFPVETFMKSCAAGGRHSFGLDNLGNIWAWGYGGNGRLGTGNTRTQHSPKMVQSFCEHPIEYISCGDLHSACIDRDGRVYTWGSAEGGKLGHKRSEEDVLTPTIVEGLSGIRIVQVECGTGITLALAENGTVYRWGCILGLTPMSDAGARTIHVPQEVTDVGSKNIFIAAGPYSCAVVNVYGDIKTWGVGSCFRLGHGDVADCPSPKFVAELRTKIFVDMLLTSYDKAQTIPTDNANMDINPAHGFNEKRIQQLSAGMSHGALLTCNGTMYIWGAHKGTGVSQDTETTETYYEPTLLSHFSTKIKRIACGSNHTIVVTVAGMVFSWGCNDSGQLGLGDLRPRVFPEHVSTLEYAINVFAGYNNTCCITTTKHDNFVNDEVGSAWVFGSASGGKLGLGETCTVSSVMTPRKLTYISGVYKVVLGNTHSLLLQHDGVVYATGSGANGRLGTGDTGVIHSFKRINTELKFIDIAVGSSHSLAISMEHDLYGWGKGKYITKTDESLLQPTLIDGLPSQIGVSKVIAVSAVANHSFVISEEGHLIAWGDNSSGQLGVPLMAGDASIREFIERPSVVLIDSPVISVVTSRFYSACATVKGDAFAWGTSSDGRLGIGQTHDKITYKPTAIATMSLMCDILERFDNMGLNDCSSYISAVESYLNELHFREDKNVIDWKSLQLLLKNEERVFWESSVKSFEDDLVSCLKQHVDFIMDMDKYHRDLDALQFRLKVAIKGFVNRLGNPRPCITDTTDGLVKQYMRFKPDIERLIEIVFLQPSYLVRLCLFGEDFVTVQNVVASLYKRLDLPRVHNQFVALLFTLLREDVHLYFKHQNPLNASCSPFARMLKTYATSKMISATNAHLFYSHEFKDSIANFVAQKRLVLPNAAAPNSEELKQFGDFIVHLSKILTMLVVPLYIKMAFKRMRDIIKFKIPSWWVLPNVPLENVAIYPLIPVFVYSVLQPYFSDAATLSDIHGYNIADNETVVNNFNVVSQYLDFIVNPCLRMQPSRSAEVNRATMTLYRNVSLMLLEYIKTLLNVEDTFNIDITMETFKSHFDVEKLRVDLPSWHIAQLVNICASARKYLNLSAHDPVNKIIEGMLRSVGNEYKNQNIFSQSLIDRLQHMQKTCCIEIEHRFMISEKNMSICKFSGVFLPQRLAYRQSTYSEDCIKLISLIIRYVPVGKYDSPRIIQNALARLKQLDVVPGDFDALILELERAAEYYTALPTPDYTLAKVARDLCAQLMKIDRTRTTAADLVTTILTKVIERYHQRLYLLQIYRRQGEIESCRVNFQASIREKCEYFTTCLQHASGAFVEPCIQNAALVNRVKLHSTKVIIAPSEPKVETVTFSLSMVHKNGWIICKQEEDEQRLPYLYLVFTFHPNSGCLLNLEERSKNGKERVMLETCTVPMNVLQEWSEATSESFADVFTNSAYPQGMFDIRKSYIVETFAQLMAS